MNLKSIASRAKSAIYADEVPAEQPPQPPAPAFVIPKGQPIVVGDAGFYERIFAATDYTANETVSHLFALAKPLETVITDRNLRIKAVLAQTGISVDAIVGAIDAAIKACGGERAKFEEGINGSRQQLEKQKAEAVDLEAKLFQAKEAIASAQNRLSTNTNGFNNAEIRRKTELDQARAEFLALK